MGRRLTRAAQALLDHLSGIPAGPAIKGRRRRPGPAGDLRAAADPASTLVALQAEDGSFGGDIPRTAAALASLALLGHTRLAGAHRERARAAAAWILAHPDALGALALRLISEIEQDKNPVAAPEYAVLGAGGAEGLLFAALRSSRAEPP